MKFLASCFTRTHPVIPVAKQVIICNNNGIIQEVSDDMVTLLQYEKHLLVGEFIGMIMSPFMSYIHNKILLPRYNAANSIQKNLMHIFLAAKTMKRPLIIYNIYREPIYVCISVTVVNNNFVLSLCTKSDADDFSVYLQDTIQNNKIPDAFKQSKNKMCVVTLSFRNASRYLTDYGVLKTIELHHKFHEDLLDVLKRDFYPYLYIYEITNESVVVVANADWTFNMKRYCASLVLCFLHNLYYVTTPYVTLQTGVVFDSIYHGVIDRKLRMFGVPMDLSSKYRAQCDENEICCDDNFVQKVVNEGVYTKDDLALYQRTFYIDGMRHHNSNFVNISKLNPDKIVQSSTEKDDSNKI